MRNSEINLLKECIGLKDVILFSSRMLIVWGKSVIVPDFSLKCRETMWVIVEAKFKSFEHAHIGWNRLEIQQGHLADIPEDADHFSIEGKGGVIKRALSSIDFPGPYAVKSIEIYQFTVANPESESEIVAYDGCLVFCFDDGRRFAISSYQAPDGTLGFTMEDAEINKLISLSSQKKLIA